MSTERIEVYKVIDGERDYQDSLGSDRVSIPKHPHEICEEIVMMRQYLDKAEKAWVNNPGEIGDLASLHELRKVAAMGLR